MMDPHPILKMLHMGWEMYLQQKFGAIKQLFSVDLGGERKAVETHTDMENMGNPVHSH